MALEILYIRPEGEWLSTQCAINGVLGVPFSFHKTTRSKFVSDADFEAYLSRQTAAVIEKYGDCRNLPFRGEREAESGSRAENLS